MTLPIFLKNNFRMPTATKRITLFIVLLIVVTIFCFYTVQKYIYNTNQETVNQISSAVSEQELSLKSLAELTRSNGADAVTDRFIADCKAVERIRFDTLLDALSKNISKGDLQEVNSLFFKCGSFYADRKSIMAIKLAQQVEHFDSLHTILATVTTVPSENLTTIATWIEIAEAELKTAEYFNTLVKLQGSIITDLLSGKRSDSPELVATLTEVNSVRGQMLILSKQIEVSKGKLE